jgi:hypothetical protein
LLLSHILILGIDETRASYQRLFTNDSEKQLLKHTSHAARNNQAACKCLQAA